jgi:serine protease Do
VAEGSAAHKAGLKPGDVITEVNGQPVRQSGALSSLIGMSAPGERVKLTVWRDKSARQVEARLGGIEAAEQVAGDAAPAGAVQLGLALRPLSRDERREAGVEQGLLIENVGGAAARAGVEAGDVLLAVNGRPVSNIEQIRAVLAGKPKSVALLVQRDGDKIFVPVVLG